MKKIYIKPTFEYVELRPEERLAASGNCRAEHGVGQGCPPAGNWGGGQ